MRRPNNPFKQPVITCTKIIRFQIVTSIRIVFFLPFITIGFLPLFRASPLPFVKFVINVSPVPFSLFLALRHTKLITELNIIFKIAAFGAGGALFVLTQAKFSKQIILSLYKAYEKCD